MYFVFVKVSTEKANEALKPILSLDCSTISYREKNKENHILHVIAWHSI